APTGRLSIARGDSPWRGAPHGKPRALRGCCTLRLCPFRETAMALVVGPSPRRRPGGRGMRPLLVLGFLPLLGLLYHAVAPATRPGAQTLLAPGGAPRPASILCYLEGPAVAAD